MNQSIVHPSTERSCESAAEQIIQQIIRHPRRWMFGFSIVPATVALRLFIWSVQSGWWIWTSIFGVWLFGMLLCIGLFMILERN